MDKRPIFVITHSRSCSTAFERVFITRRDILNVFHEPFGDAFYYGPEKISPALTRWPADKIAKSGKAHYTYDLVLQQILDAVNDSTKRVFIKDIAYHIIPPIHTPHASPPSLQHYLFHNDPSNPSSPPQQNPSLLPTSILSKFRFVFLIRNPAAAIPSLYRCFIPPLSALTDEHTLDPTEIGYREMRLLFDYLYPSASTTHSSPSEHDNEDSKPLLIDAEDLLADPASVIHTLCDRLGIDYTPSMLEWPGAEDHAFAKALFDKYAGYHEDALNSTGLRPKAPSQQVNDVEKPKTGEELDREWESKYGSEAAKAIREAVDACRGDYEYLRGFRMRVGGGVGE